MKIERNNYEIFFLDYFEQNLSAEEVASLFLFLENNPDLKAEFESFSNTNIDALPGIIFKDKANLIKPVVDDGNSEQMMLAEIDNTLTPDESHSLQNYLDHHPDKKKDYKLLKRTKLIPVPVFYPGKISLRKTGVTLNNYHTYFVAELEGDLTNSELKGLHRFIELHQDFAEERALLQKTKLPANKVIYPYKANLKKAIPFYTRTGFWIPALAAASIILLLGVFFFNPTKTNTPEVAHNQGQQIDENINSTIDINSENAIVHAKEFTSIPGDNNSNENSSGSTIVSGPGYPAINMQRRIVCAKINIVVDNNTEPATIDTPSEMQPFAKPDAEMIAMINSYQKTVIPRNETLATLAQNNLSKLADDSYVASTILEKNKSGRRKLFDLLATGVSKISNDKIQLTGRFNDENELAAYKLESSAVNLNNKY